MIIKDRIKTKLADAKKLQAQLAKQVELMAKENAAFAAMSDADKRVAIAKDVIAQVRSGALNVKAGNGYVFLNEAVDIRDDRDYGFTPETELKEVLCEQDCCTVCARGAMFIAGVKRFNHITLSDLGIERGQEFAALESDDIRAYEDNFFSSDQIDEIEDYFEGSGDCHTDAYYEASYNQWDDSRWDTFEGDEEQQDNSEWYDSDDGLLIAIMKNIIDNKGTFVPEKMEREVKRTAFYSAQKKKLGKKKGAK